MKIDFDHWQGSQLAEEAMAIMQTEKDMKLISMLKPEFHMDGNMYCFTYPSINGLPNDCIQGFGETAARAAADFDKNFYNQKAHNNEKRV